MAIPARPDVARRLALARLGAVAWGGVFGVTDTVQAGLPEVVEAVRASVLPVGTYSATDSPRFGFRGTGFVVGDGNLVATNFHVLPEGAGTDTGPHLAVINRQGTEAQVRGARVVASDGARDLALLRIDGTPLPALKLGATSRAREGQDIAFVGYPIGGVLGFSPVTHRGIIASITTIALPAPTAGQLDPRAVMRLREGNFDVYQLDATAYPGNSGGPVLDVASGRVIAVINMVLVKGSRESALSHPTGISYAIPIDHLIELLKQR